MEGTEDGKERVGVTDREQKMGRKRWTIHTGNKRGEGHMGDSDWEYGTGMKSMGVSDWEQNSERNRRGDSD